ncbi:nitroreductase family protein [Pseudalkalibacillus caeni]|uniref:Putative NAD(P)H nitroreductase n=1 Tax=Exobacillus caeni TaxID=2574798 RepID=A0A5R9F9S2_9BACL|nr:nitroreductase [Pseudalkalibacillus caeni]TLS38990.1 nitroreductase [Pseudalkalibacillus caeni]
MDVLEAIRTRRSIGVVKQDSVPKDLIEKILEAGNWAPSHYKTEPWKFFVLENSARNKLGDVLVEIAKESMDDPTTEENKRKLKKTAAKPLRAPVIIAVAVTPSQKKKVIELEEYAAVNAGIQNMLLVAHALGLGAIWRTGKPCYHSKMLELFRLSEEERVLGFIYIGYPDMKAPSGSRGPVEEKTVWINSDKDLENL